LVLRIAKRQDLDSAPDPEHKSSFKKLQLFTKHNLLLLCKESEEASSDKKPVPAKIPDQDGANLAPHAVPDPIYTLPDEADYEPLGVSDYGKGGGADYVQGGEDDYRHDESRGSDDTEGSGSFAQPQGCHFL
jgi:hypothetical protein